MHAADTSSRRMTGQTTVSSGRSAYPPSVTSQVSTLSPGRFSMLRAQQHGGTSSFPVAGVSRQWQTQNKEANGLMRIPLLRWRSLLLPAVLCARVPVVFTCDSQHGSR